MRMLRTLCSRPLFHPVAALLVVLVLASFSLADAQPERRYLRYVEDAQPRLETSIVHLENAAGVKVDLIGAVHIADSSYFEQLNERFKTYEVVLYEMVKPRGMDDMSQRSGSDSWISMLQKFLKTQLDLSFQLDEIDYTPANFVHADLDAETFAQRQAERGENMITMMVNSMLREMAKAQDRPQADQPTIFDIITALQAPDSSKQLKLIMAKQFEAMEESLDSLGGDDSVIIGERNREALKILREQMDGGKKHLAIFYGAGHLQGMEELMTDLMGFKAVGEPEWLTAWDLRDQAPKRRSSPPSRITAPATQPANN